MYEDKTFEAIMEDCLARVPDTLDKREGSIIYDALAPMAAELAQLYVEMGALLDESYADTASRDNLIRRCAERGIYPTAATAAVLRGEFNIAVPIGSRFALGDLTYVVTELISGTAYRLTCETAGAASNAALGNLIPIDYVEGLTSAALTELLIPGEDEEDTEALRQRYLSSLNSQAYGGNIQDYKDKVGLLTGVGGLKVYPVWDGPGTVKLVIIDASYGAPSGALLADLQAAIDPQATPGQGLGIAPIGHVVTLAAVGETTVNIATTLTYQSGWNWAAVEPYAQTVVDSYFAELAQAWAESDALIVRISQLEIRFLGLAGVVDVTGTTINGTAANLVLDADAIPVRGTLNG